jgi:hypothetical protein
MGGELRPAARRGEDTLAAAIGIASPLKAQEQTVSDQAVTEPVTATAPSFLIRAEKDPKNANLDRLQMVKGWVDAAGIEHEKIYNVVWSGNRTLDTAGKLPAVGNTVDLTTGDWSDTIGAPALAAVWSDPDFDPTVPAFYYVRVLQIPTARHSLLDKLALNGIEDAPWPDTLQERAYTSPIWYTP